MSAEEVTLHVEGEIDLTTCDMLFKRLRGLLLEGCRRVRVDLSGVRHLDSSGISLIVTAFEDFRAVRGRLLLVNVPTHVSRVLHALGLQFLMWYDLEVLKPPAA